MKRQLLVCSVLAGLLGAQEVPPGKDLGKLDLEQIMDLKVSSVQRREQKLGKAAAAVYVITQDDIRRSGLTSLPEVLR